jgi:hypothetical protein
MNIVYLISTLKRNSGKGGHYNSLKTIANEIATFNNVTVINIGVNDSPVLSEETNSFNYIFLRIGKFSLLTSFRRLNDRAVTLNPEIIHCFDRSSFLWGSYISEELKLGLFLTKCGGRIPKWFPKIKNLIVFNPRDFDFFNEKFSTGIKVYLIPNRVGLIKPDHERIDRLRSQYVKDGELVLLRIARFSQLNLKSIEQSINLVRSLSGKIKIRLIVIGDDQDKHVYESVLSMANDSNISIISDPFFTRGAQQLIPVSDAVISSGRSLMEAAYFERPVLVPNQNFDIPVLLSEKTFSKSFYENFSYRTDFNGFSIVKESVLRDIYDVLTNDDSKSVNRDFLQKINSQYFLLAPAIPKYMNLYANSEYAPYDSLKTDFLINFFHVYRGVI